MPGYDCRNGLSEYGNERFGLTDSSADSVKNKVVSREQSVDGLQRRHYLINTGDITGAECRFSYNLNREIGHLLTEFWAV